MNRMIRFQTNSINKGEQNKCIQRAEFKYMRNKKNSKCSKIILNRKTFNKIICETFSYADDETGGVFIGYIYDNVWYIIDSIDAGLLEKTTHTRAFFKYDEVYVNHQIKKQKEIYKYVPYILGFWHRHPFGMDTFSMEDEKTMSKHCKISKHGILSMLVNIDPELRMTFYYASKNNELFNIQYEVGEIPDELNELASYEEITARYNNNIKLKEVEKLADTQNTYEGADDGMNGNIECKKKYAQKNMSDKSKTCEKAVIISSLNEEKLLARIAKMEANRYVQEEKMVVPKELLEDNDYIGALYGFMPDTGVYTVISGEKNRKITSTEIIGYKVANKDDIESMVEDVTKNVLFLLDQKAYIYDVKKKELRSILLEPYSLIQSLTSRHSGLIETDWMKDATAIISGCGSVGSLVALQLARSGVGNIVLIDPEILEIHNICRHQLTLVDVGKKKVEAIGEKIKNINPDCNVKVFAEPFEDVSILSYEEMIVDKDKTIFIGACDNRISNANVSEVAMGLRCAFAAIGFLPRAWGAEIFTMLPGELGYNIVFKKQITDAVIEERNNRLYLGDEDKGKVSFVPGLGVDIEYGTSLFDKIVLDIINRNNSNYKMRIYNNLSSQFSLLAGTTDIPDAFYKKYLEPFVPTSIELSDEFYKVRE